MNKRENHVKKHWKNLWSRRGRTPKLGSGGTHLVPLRPKKVAPPPMKTGNAKGAAMEVFTRDNRKK
jgi:hypothetical protein